MSDHSDVGDEFYHEGEDQFEGNPYISEVNEAF